MLAPEVVVQDTEDWKLSEILRTVSDHGNRSQLLLPLFLPWLAPVLLSAPCRPSPGKRPRRSTVPDFSRLRLAFPSVTRIGPTGAKLFLSARLKKCLGGRPLPLPKGSLSAWHLQGDASWSYQQPLGQECT